MRILILEDEKPAANRLELLVKQLLKDQIESIKILSSLEEADIFFLENYIDLLFLDIDLKGKNGLHYLDNFLKKSFHTIVVSGKIEFALKAFEYAVNDFIPKPVTAKRLKNSLGRLSEDTVMPLTSIPVKVNKNIQYIPMNNILYLETKNKETKIFCKNRETYKTQISLSSFEKKLSTNFMRCHKSFIINTKETKNIEIESSGIYYAKISNGESLPVGRSYYQSLKKNREKTTE